MNAREEILARIRSAVPGDSGARGSSVEAARSYRAAGSLDDDAKLALFEERIREYGVQLTRCSPQEVRAAIEGVLGARGARSVVVPPGYPEAWMPRDVETLPDAPEALSIEELARVDGVLSACAVAIAETGTLALDAGPGQGRRALTLVPDYHLCIVLVDQVVETVPEAVRRLEASAEAGKPVTLVSGPSATSDIELNRVSGVHGPRTLDVILVG